MVTLIVRLFIVFYFILSGTVFADNLIQSNRLFDWAESQLPVHFSPYDQQTFEIQGFQARYYPDTDNYMATKNGNVYLFGNAIGGLLELGPLDDMLSLLNITTDSGYVFMEDAGPAQMAGWSDSALQTAKDYWENYGSTSVVILEKGYIIAKWGDAQRPISCYSVRKSFLSALYGIAVEADLVDTAWKLEALDIDDSVEPGLTDAEKQATVRQLLMARSGVYHPAAYETDTMKNNRPARGSHAPGTFYYYNNWDFNALGTIYTKLTGNGVFEAFQNQIAKPVGMQHFSLSDMEYVFENDVSDHPAYTFKMSTLDRARFGLLFLNRGKWRGQQIIPVDWIDTSTTAYSNVSSGVGYGYMWWVSEGGWLKGTKFEGKPYSARGNHRQYILIIPSRDLVVVQSVDWSAGDDINDNLSFNDLFALIVAAQIQ